MPDYTRTVQMLAEGEYGPSASLRFSHQDAPRRCLAWLTRATDNGGEQVVALAAGPDHAVACRGLLRQLSGQRPVRLTTEEVAGALGVTVGRVHHFVTDGRLPAEGSRAGAGSGRFAPAEVHRFALLPRRQGQRNDLARAQAERREGEARGNHHAEVLTHITSNTGHVARTARSEVGDDVIAALRPIVEADGGWLPGDLAWYLDVWRALDPETHKPIGGAAAYQVAGGPHDTPEGKAPFVLCVGCWREDASERAWRLAHEAADLLARAAPEQSGYANRLPAKVPPVPWLSVTVYPMAEFVGDKLGLLGDLERCVLWTLAEGGEGP